jgi:hypothetical protein
MGCWIERGCVVLIIGCILSIFFFPANFGPFAAVHGPICAARTLEQAARLHHAITRSPLDCSGIPSTALPTASIESTVLVDSEFNFTDIPDVDAALRC